MMGKRHLNAPTMTTATPPRTEVIAMLHRSEPESRSPLAVRGGTGAPVTCATCGCRLSSTGEAWFHFNPLGGRDARGCRIACADAAHDVHGQPISISI